MRAFYPVCIVVAGAVLSACDQPTGPSVELTTSKQTSPPPPESVTGRALARFDSDRVGLSGITITATQRLALLTVDHAPPVAHAVGDTLLGARLASIESDFVVFDADGSKVRVSFPKEIVQAGRVAHDAPPELGALAKALAPGGGATIAPMAAQEKMGAGNAAFLAAIEQAARKGRDTSAP